MTNLTTAEEGAKEPGIPDECSDRAALVAYRVDDALLGNMLSYAPNGKPCLTWHGVQVVGGLFDEELDAAESRAATAEAEVERLRAAHEPAVSAIMEANNSLYGSQGYFLSLNGGPPNKHHLANGIEDLKKRTRDDYVAKRAAESEAQALREKMVRLLIAFHDAIRRPLGVTPDSGAEFYDARLADEAEQRRAALKGGPDA